MVINSISETGGMHPARTDADRQAAAIPLRDTVDRRLTSGRLPGITVDVLCRDRTIARCAVRAFGSQELVLIVPSAAAHPTAGDLVTFSICKGDTPLLREQSGVAHWAVAEADSRIVGVFSGNRLDQLLDHHLLDERRIDIRYPVDLQAFIDIEFGQQEARIVNYSLHGLCLVNRTPLELSRPHVANVICDDGHVRLSVTPQWIRNSTDGHLIGCALTPQYGMLLTCRHTASAVAPNIRPDVVS